MRRLALLVCLGLLGGCGSLTALEAGSVVATEKTFSDHIISYASGKDCSSVRREMGTTYCKEDEVTITPNVFCYNTLGRVTCYDRPDPYQRKQRQVGINDHNLVQ
jgi:hypothetical protein